jgi:hypothetical protein
MTVAPVANLIGYFVTDSFDFPKLIAFSCENFLRPLEYLQQFSQPHWPDCRQHIERDACFRRVHL